MCAGAGRATWKLWRTFIMDKIVIYIHGKGGNAEESVHYQSLFSDCDVVGLNYTAQFPWKQKKNFHRFLICL